MRALHSLLLALTLVSAALASVGCKSQPADPVAELRKARDQMCGCTDAACADRVQPRVDAWTAKHASTHGAKPEATAMVSRIALCRENAGGDPLAREIVTELLRFQDRACACADEACARAVQEEQAKWLFENQARLAPVKSTELQTKESNRIAGQTERCVRKHLGPPGAKAKTPPTSPAPPSTP